MIGSYDLPLVALSYAIAALASYVALTLASHMARAEARTKNYWLLGGAFAMGAGIWSMHFIGMIAFRLPVAVSYEVAPTLLSLAIAVLVSAFALFTVNRARLTAGRLVVSGCLMGIGIAAMHFKGMAALRMYPAIRYDGLIVGASVAIAIAASIVALRIAFHLRSSDNCKITRARICSALVMGGAIAGMHYTGMAAATFAEGSICLGGPGKISGFWLAATVAACSVLCLSATLLVRSGAPRTRGESERGFGIRFKIASSYLVVCLFVTVFAVATLWVQLDAAESIATLEAEEIARLIIDTMGDDPIKDVAGLRKLVVGLHIGERDGFIVDRNHRILVDANADEVGTLFSKDRNDAIALTMRDGLARTFVESREPPAGDTMQLVLPLYENRYDAGSEIAGAFVLEYTRTYEALLAKARSLAYMVGALGIGCVVFTSFLGLRVASAIASPLKEIGRGARAVASGQYDVRVAVQSTDEMGTLATAFNKMAHDLGETHGRLLDHQRELEDRVTQRTLEWQQAAAAQRESVAEMRLIAEHMPAALSYADRDMRFRYHNTRFARMLGIDDAQVDNRSVVDVYGAENYAAVAEPFAEALRGHQVTYERRHAQAGAPVQYLQTTLVPRIGENGVAIGCYAMTQDISERKLAEEALRQSNVELTRANVRLHEMSDQLVQSEKMASIGQLAAGVAHEINNPIGFVQSNLGTLDRYLRDIFGVLENYREAESAIADPALRARIAAAKEAADIEFVKEDIAALLAQSKDGISRVTKIVRDLKNFSRSATDEVWQWADLHRGLDSTLNIVWNELKYKADVVKDYGALPEVQCRPSQINQIFMNLLLNGAQAIKQRGTLTIRSGVEGERVWLDFTDTGEGIKPEHLARIFDPFFTTKPVGQGTGLGLSLAYGIIKEHGGKIEVQSILGKGTTFRVWMPIRQAGTARAGHDNAGQAAANEDAACMATRAAAAG